VYEASKEMISFSEENTYLWSRLFGAQAGERHCYSSVGMRPYVENLRRKCNMSSQKLAKQHKNTYIGRQGSVRFASQWPDSSQKRFLGIIL
jgi:hypothetical protein